MDSKEVFLTKFVLSYFHHKSAEYSQTDVGVQRVRDWVTSFLFLSDDAFLYVDEILRRSTILQLQWGKTKSEVISGALWMPLGNLNNSYRSAFAVSDLPHLFGNMSGG